MELIFKTPKIKERHLIISTKREMSLFSGDGLYFIPNYISSFLSIKKSPSFIPLHISFFPIVSKIQTIQQSISYTQNKNLPKIKKNKKRTQIKPSNLPTSPPTNSPLVLHSPYSPALYYPQVQFPKTPPPIPNYFHLPPS